MIDALPGAGYDPATYRVEPLHTWSGVRSHALSSAYRW
jgi:hypothetical protein